MSFSTGSGSWLKPQGKPHQTPRNLASFSIQSAKNDKKSLQQSQTNIKIQKIHPKELSYYDKIPSPKKKTHKQSIKHHHPRLISSQWRSMRPWLHPRPPRLHRPEGRAAALARPWEAQQPHPRLGQRANGQIK